MKKRTLLILVALAVFTAFLAMLPVAYSGANSVLSNEFMTKVNHVTQQHLADMERSGVLANGNNSDEDYARYMIAQRQSEMYDYPYFGLIFDKEGNVVAQSGNYIEISDDNWGRTFCSLDKYINSEIKKQLSDLQKNASPLLYGRVYKFEYNIENGEIVPVRIIFSHDTPDETIVTFSDTEAQFSAFSDDSKTRMTIYLYDIDEQHYNHKAHQELKSKINLEELSQQAVEKLSDDNFSGGGSWSSNFFDYETDIEINDERYYLVEFAQRNVFLDTVTSSTFRNFVIEGSFYFILLGAVLLIVVNKIYNKNERLKKSRLAFISAAAHELKTPIAIISNQCELVLENIAPEKNTEYIRSVYDESLRMNKLVSTLLQYNKLNSIENVAKEYENIDKIVKEELAKYEPMITEKNLIVVTDLQPQSVKCNKELIALAVDNFISNAIRHTPTAGTIEVKVKSSGVSVYNEGSHIDEKDAAHIWEDFYKEDKSRQRSDNSTGMGLAICKRIFELHSFKYRFKNCENGVQFEFDIK